MSTHNICFLGEIRKNCGYPLLTEAMKVFVMCAESSDSEA